MTGGKKTSILLVIWHRQQAGLANVYFDSSKIQTSPLVQNPILLMSEWFSVASDPLVLSPKRIHHLLLILLPGLLFLGILSKSILLLGTQRPHHKRWNVFTMLKNLWASIYHFNFNLIRKDSFQQCSVLLSLVKRPLKKKKFILPSYKFLTRD